MSSNRIALHRSARHRVAALVLSLLVLVPLLAPGSADEGMWTFDNPPMKLLQERYGFSPTPEWLERVRLSSVRINDGGSGSFVSPTGLVLTNHHVALGQLEKVSTPQKNYVKDGFYARTRAEEPKSPDLEMNVLVSAENVTPRVEAAVKAGMSDAQAFLGRLRIERYLLARALDARRAAIAALEKESLAATGLRSDVVPLYHGGEYWLYRSKRYTDIRLVFAPEQQAAFFGGDPDNFTYPRYDLDMALFRVYENDKPIDSRNYLTINPKGAAESELVFISGHPGSTDRLETMAQLETARDLTYPTGIQVVQRRLATLRRYAQQGPEQARQAAGFTFNLENALKAFNGEYQGLQNPKVMVKKQAEERDFRARVDSRPEWKSKYADAWDQIGGAEEQRRAHFKETRFRAIRGSSLAALALTLVEYVAEIRKPDGERLPGFHDAELPSLQQQLFSPAPVYPQLEEVLLADSLQDAREQLGSDDPFVKAALDGRSADEIAHEAMAGTRLTDPATRKTLVEGGEAAVAASTDPLVVLARRVDPTIRETQKWLRDHVESVETAAQEKIGKARFAVYGHSVYPDATFTLRLSFGTVKGYPMNGTQAPPFTTFYGLYDRARGFGLKPPFQLTPPFAESVSKIDLATPFNFVTTNDVIGGNSGSPVINRQGELVGLIFDGNIESLVGRFVYEEETNRAVAVHPAAIIEALEKVYNARPLADELKVIRTAQ